MIHPNLDKQTYDTQMHAHVHMYVHVCRNTHTQTLADMVTLFYDSNIVLFVHPF